MFPSSARLMNPGLRRKRQHSADSSRAIPVAVNGPNYRLFLLEANERDEQAMKECLQIPKRCQDDQIVRWWRATIRR